MDVYKISVALAMSSNHNAVLSALATQLLHVQANVNTLTGGFNRLKVAIGGALSITAGVAILDTMGKLVDKTKDYSDELVKLQRLGGDMARAVASGDISRRAFDISQRVPMRVTDLMKIPGATYSILGQQESMQAWESLARASWVMQSQKDYQGDPQQDLQKLLRAGELSGRITDPATGKIDMVRLEKYLDMSTQIMAATHNMVNSGTLLGMAKQGGFTLRGLSDEGFYTQAIMSQAMGGPRAGTAFLSLWQQMAAGTMFTRTAEGMEKLGLLKPGEWHTDHGRVILGDEAAHRLTKLIGKDPLDFAANIVARLKERGITDPEDQMRLVMGMLNRQTTQRYSAEMVTNFQQMIAERERMRQGYQSGQSFSLINDKSISANLQGLKNAWDNFLTALAGPNSENVIKVLQAMTHALNTLQAIVTRMDPATLIALGEGIAVLGTALIGAGAVAIVAALGPAGWIAAGLIALGAGVTALVRSNWQQLTNIFDNIKNAIASFIDSIAHLYDRVRDFFSHAPEQVYPGGTLRQHSSFQFVPGVGHKREQFAFSLNIDGDRIAQTIIDKIEARYRYDTNTPAFNGAGRYGA